MKKFNITVDEKCSIWRRCSIEIEANSIEEAEDIAFKKDISEESVDYMIDTAFPISRKEEAAMYRADYLMPEENWEEYHGLTEDNNVETVCIVEEASYEIENSVGPITAEDLPELKRLYAKHKDTPAKIIYYKQEEILISYLKYLIEYLGQNK